MKKSFLIGFLWLLPCSLIANHFLVEQYDYSELKSGVQNWSIAWDSTAVYAANSDGLLRYNGLDWSILSPNQESAVYRAVLPLGKKIYVAGDGCLGYWYKDEQEAWQYVSLLPLVQSIQRGVGEKFWSIQTMGEDIYFQSFDGIIRYDGTQMYDVARGGFQFLLKVGEELFTSNFDHVLCKVYPDTVQVLFNNLAFPEEIRFVHPIGQGVFLAGTTKGAIYRLAPGETPKFQYRITSPGGCPVRIDCSTQRGEQIAIGTLGHGLVLLDWRKNTWTFITEALQDLNIHGLCYADDKQIWLALDRGIASIHLDSDEWIVSTPKNFGVFFDVVKHNEQVFYASNSGLFSPTENIYATFFPFQFANYKNQLLCGAFDNLYYYNDRKKSFEPSPYTLNGVLQFECVETPTESLLYLRSYGGISILKWQNGRWGFFSHPEQTSYYLNILPQDPWTIWATHIQDGLIRMRLSDDLQTIAACDTFTTIDGMSIQNGIGMFTIEKTLYYILSKGVYRYNETLNNFENVPSLSSLVETQPNLRQIKSQSKDEVWIISNDRLCLYKIKDEQAELLFYKSFVHNNILWYDGHCNLRVVEDSLAYISTSRGTILFRIHQGGQSQSNRSLFAESITYIDHGKKHHVPLADVVRLPYTATNICVSIAGCPKNFSARYLSYFLSGVSAQWSGWQSTGKIQFEKLPDGKYPLLVRSSADYQSETHVITLQIAPPWYRTWIAWLCWCVLFIVILGLFWLWLSRHITYRELRKRHEEQERNFRENMRHLVHKQEVLDAVMEEVEKQKEQLGQLFPKGLESRLTKIITSGKSEKDKLLTYENYFVESQREFMIRLHKAYPDLSASELRFACLIRSNLTTKEIAEILNVIPHSVELRRYRLKQSIGLTKEDSLSAFIFSI